MFLRYTVVFTTLSQPLPAACKMAERFFMTCSVCLSTPPLIRLPLAGSKQTWPEIKSKPLALMAWEYGPIALGALGVEIASRDCPLIDLPPMDQCRID